MVTCRFGHSAAINSAVQNPSSNPSNVPAPETCHRSYTGTAGKIAGEAGRCSTPDETTPGISSRNPAETWWRRSVETAGRLVRSTNRPLQQSAGRSRRAGACRHGEARAAVPNDSRADIHPRGARESASKRRAEPAAQPCYGIGPRHSGSCREAVILQRGGGVCRGGSKNSICWARPAGFLAGRGGALEEAPAACFLGNARRCLAAISLNGRDNRLYVAAGRAARTPPLSAAARTRELRQNSCARSDKAELLEKFVFGRQTGEHLGHRRRD